VIRDHQITAKHQFIIYDDFNCPEVGSNQLDVILEDLQQRSDLMQHVYATWSNNTLDLRMTSVSNNGTLRWSSDMPQRPSSCRLSSAHASSPADHFTLQLLRPMPSQRGGVSQRCSVVDAVHTTSTVLCWLTATSTLQQQGDAKP